MIRTCQVGHEEEFSRLGPLATSTTLHSKPDSRNDRGSCRLHARHQPGLRKGRCRQGPVLYVPPFRVVEMVAVPFCTHVPAPLNSTPTPMPGQSASIGRLHHHPAQMEVGAGTVSPRARDGVDGELTRLHPISCILQINACPPPPHVSVLVSGTGVFRSYAYH